MFVVDKNTSLQFCYMPAVDFDKRGSFRVSSRVAMAASGTIFYPRIDSSSCITDLTTQASKSTTSILGRFLEDRYSRKIILLPHDFVGAVKLRAIISTG